MWKKPNRNYISKYVRYNSLRYRERKYNTLIFYHYIIARSFFVLYYYYILFSTTRHENYFDMLHFFYVSLNIKRKKDSVFINIQLFNILSIETGTLFALQILLNNENFERIIIAFSNSTKF